MENTAENKAKFFALYWGQKIRFYKLTYSWRRNEEVQGSTNGYIQLTPLSQITDEDAIEVGRIIWLTRSHIEHLKEEIRDIFSDDFLSIKTPVVNLISAIDYLRSKGYALPWMGLSVEQLVSFGWVKLKEATNEH